MATSGKGVATGTLKPYDVESPLESMMEGASLLRSESMEITNDPRFFNDNVINYRLAAFGGIAVVSGLMVQNSMDHLFDMKKEALGFGFRDVDSCMQLIAMILLASTLFLNLLSTYVGVAQPYHTIRLMTAGPTGFEAAATYYLHKDLIVWRHTAVKGALWSLPIFALSSAFRMTVKFDRENYDFDKHYNYTKRSQPPEDVWAMGLVMFCLYFLMFVILVYVHIRHDHVFQDRYKFASHAYKNHLEATATMKTGNATPRVASDRSWLSWAGVKDL